MSRISSHELAEWQAYFLLAEEDRTRPASEVLSGQLRAAFQRREA